MTPTDPNDLVRRLWEAPWVSDMRAHFAQHGYYPRDDLARLLGNPGDAAAIGPDGHVFLKSSRQALQTKEERDE